ncbi:MAG: Serine phosphatase RsbU, regulator of sigma subunit [Acidobacteriales bacterium]|nr:Serine phosphatase RsbU, regulator of sigma subunit [Terriglobales bacterium]
MALNRQMSPLSSSSAIPIKAQPPSHAGNSIFPSMLFVHGAEQRELRLSLLPFCIGRKSGKDLEIPDPRISRDHAEIVCEEGDYYVIDCGSKLGTYVNKERVQRRKLVRNDRIEFGIGVGAHLVFDPIAENSVVAREFLSQLSVISVDEKSNDLEKLALFLEAARKLNTSDAFEEILLSLIGTTLKLTGAERGFIFVCRDDGGLALSAACTSSGERLTSDKTISHSILADAAKAASEFIVTDTMKVGEMAARQSIVAHDLRTVIAIPLRKAHGQQSLDSKPERVLGVLYLDSRFASGSISGVSHDILGVIAREAAALVESTRLAQAEEAGRRYQQELTIAATIQQRLMTVTIPELSFATLSAKNLPCRDIGGDFYDVVVDEQGLTVVVTDVSGKGISAAILASILQGLIYSQVVAQVPLQDIVTSANRFLCQRVHGEKYATALILRLTPDGEVTYVNCGHVPPVLVRKRHAERILPANLPVGLLEEATFTSGSCRLEPGDRLILVTDGVTEAEDCNGEFFGDERLEQAATLMGEDPCFDHVLAAIREFCGVVPLSDDCTLLELVYRGRPKHATEPTMKMPAGS